MIRILLPEKELYDEVNNKFVYLPSRELILEHSLVSISKWESKWHKSFLNTDDKSFDEVMDYIKCMCVEELEDENDLYRLSEENVSDINAYIQDSMTATTFSDFSDNKNTKSREIITSEIIYYWMIANNIPFECQYWHLNKLLTLIKVCSIKNSPEKKMSTSEILSRNKALNAARRKKMNSKYILTFSYYIVNSKG